MNKHRLMIFVPFLLALGMVLAAFAFARASVPEAQASAQTDSNLPAAAANPDSSLQKAPLLAQASQARSKPEGNQPVEVKSNAALIPGFLKNDILKPAFLPEPAPLQVTTQGTVAGSRDQVGRGSFGASPAELQPGFTVDMALDAVMGRVFPGDQIEVAVGSAYGAAVADATGFFWTPIWQPGGMPLDLVAGETIQIWVNGSLADTVTPVEVTGGLDVLANVVSGNLAGLGAGIPVIVTLGAWGSLPPDGAPVDATTADVSGDFLVIFPDIHLTAAYFPQVEYLASTSSYVRTYLRTEPSVFVVENFSRVAGYGAPGQDVAVNVYLNYPYDIRWQGGGETDGRFGFYVVDGVDSQVGDVVEVIIGGASVMTTTIANLHDITFDASTDQVSGTAPEDEAVLVYAYGWADDAQTYMEAHATAVPGDTFAVSLPADLRANHSVAVQVSDVNGHSTVIYGGAPYIEALIDLDQGIDCVQGRVEAPNQPVTLTLEKSTGEFYTRVLGGLSYPGNTIGPPSLCYVIRDQDDNVVNFDPDDILSIHSPNWSGSMDIVEVPWQADTNADQVTGNAPDGEVRLVVSRFASQQYPTGGSATRQVVASGNSFAADFSSFDLRDEDNVHLWHYAAATDFATQDFGNNFSETYVHYFTVYAPWGVFGMASYVGESVTASLYDDTGAWLASSSGINEDWGFWLADFQSNPFAPGFWITVTGDSGWSAGYQIPYLTIQADESADLIWGEGPKDRLFMETSWGFNAFIPSDGYILDAMAYGHDLSWGDGSNIYYLAPSGDRFIQTVRWPYLAAQYGSVTNANHVWGGGAPLDSSVPVTVTDPGGSLIVTATLQANIFGDFNSEEFPPGTIAAGNFVHADFGSSVEALQVMAITGEANPDTDVITITGEISTPIYVSASGPYGWWESNWSYPDAVIGPEGYVAIDTSVDGYDIAPGTYFDVFAHQVHGHDTVYSFWLEVLNLNSNYGHDWVEGNFESGHTIWITLTDSTGAIKATATGETAPIPWWGDQTGFSTNYNVPWEGQQPDMQAGDWVYARLDSGLTTESHLGEITAEADVVNDLVQGMVNASWYTETLYASCGIWEDNGPGIDFDVDPNGGEFACDFSGIWDIIPGHMIGVSYHEPDGDQVINMASNPAPNLRIQTWADGQPASGGNFMFYVQYGNNGTGDTQDATITAVLEGGMTYLSDTSGFPVSGIGTPADPLVWQLGTVPPNSENEIRFYLFVEVTAAPGDWITNTVQIENGIPYDQDNPDEKYSQWSGQVVENDTWIGISKGAWTWDPVPGTQFVYNVSVCNHGSTASDEMLVTDTLPLSTTLISWWGQYPGWQEVSFSDHELVVSHPSLPGYWCSEVYLLVELAPDAWFGMPLHNQAEVYASSDLSPEDNQTSIDHSVGYPHTNLGIQKQWNWGELVPGGQIRYQINFYNDGNMPVENVWITETLPTSTTFLAAYWYDEVGGHPFPPDLVTDEIVAWQISSLMAGYGFNFELVLEIEPQASPGLELVNTADITPLPGEDRYDDNTSSWTEMLYDHGPNLRVRKQGDWHGHGDGHNAWFNLIVENVGDLPAEHVTVTDTLPVSMTLDGDPSTDWSQVESYVRNDAEGWFSFTFYELHPNWRRDINMNVYVPTWEPVVPGGLFFTNQAEIDPLEGEPTYDDNQAEYTLASGPDLYVEKSLVAGELMPGEEVTFSLLFGNDQVGHAWWWNLQGTAWLTDVLPAGSEFITATQRWCGDTPWCPVPPDVQDGTLVWQLWPIGGDQWNEFYVTVRLPDFLNGLDMIVNSAEIASDQPDVDIEYDTTNNTARYEAWVDLPFFYMWKESQSSAVAGTLITYTLTVDNIGHADGTGVTVSDKLPEGLTYMNGGTYDPMTGEVFWLFPELPMGEGEGMAFTAQLTCEAGFEVVNEDYRVVSSDQGITSTVGMPITITTLAPTIDASFIANPLTPVVGETVHFTATALTNGSPVIDYAWDFGDGVVASGDWSFASHAYTAAGSYTVTLTATDTCGYTTTYTLVMEVASSMHEVYLPLVGK